MAEPAYEQLEEYEVPAGGIADFIVPDEEIEAMDRRDAERAFGNAGIANFKDVAARMADYGRYGDDTVAHLQTGEIVIPAALIADNPALKESIFDDLRARGIEDPERYVVGSPENSINPDTGLPEFFLKKLFKGVKKAFKKVGKFLKKAAGVILPVALSFTPLGPVFGAALGSGIASLIQGGNLKDAFKAAAIAGATGGILKGVSSVAQGGTFMGGIKEAVQIGPFAPAAAPGAAVPGANVPVVDAVPSVAGGELTAKGLQEAAAAKASGLASGLPPVTDAVPVFDRAADVAARNLANTQQVSAALDAGLQPLAGAGSIPGGAATTFTPGVGAGAPSGVTRAIAMRPGETVQQALARAGGGASTVRSTITSSQPFTTAPAGAGASGVGSISIPTATSGAGAAGVTQAAAPGAAPSVAPPPAADAVARMPLEAPLPGVAPATAQTQQSFARKFIPDPVERLYDQYLSPSRGMLTETHLQNSPEFASALEKGASYSEALASATRQLQPGVVSRYGPLAALAGAGLYAGGFFETPEQEELTIGYPYTGFDLLAQNPEYYGLPGGYIPPVYTPPPNIPDMTAAKGGEVYPRRNGGIMPYEGTPDEDSVRALLMPGEFVMTKDAVTGESRTCTA
jgi:hypothetical protein